MTTIIEFLAPFIPAAAFLAFLLGDAFSDAFRFRDVLKKFGVFKEVVSEYNSEKITRDTIIKTLTPNTQWHRWQAVRQAAVIALAAWAYQSLPALALFASIFWLVHDGIVNIVGLDRKFFFVGTTAWIDRQFQKFAKPELALAVTKFGMLAASAAAYFIF